MAVGSALVFTAMLFGALGFGAGWWFRNVTFEIEDARSEAGKPRNKEAQ